MHTYDPPFHRVYIFVSTMGLFLSILSKGVPSVQSVGALVDDLYNGFMNQKPQELERFHAAILDAFSKLNTMFPGRHYDAPTYADVMGCFNKEWKDAKDEEGRKNVFIGLITKNVKSAPLELSAVLTGMATPPAAMAAKRAGENLPQLKMLKFVPDVVFVPSITLVALAAAKLNRTKSIAASSTS